MDYLHFQHAHQAVSVDVDLDGSTTAYASVAAATSANHQLFIQRITLSILTHANTKTVTVQDTAGTPVLIAKHEDFTAAVGVPSSVIWNFGVRGTALTKGKDLSVLQDASGIVGRIHIEGYQKLQGTVSA